MADFAVIAVVHHGEDSSKTKLVVRVHGTFSNRVLKAEEDQILSKECPQRLVGKVCRKDQKCIAEGAVAFRRARSLLDELFRCHGQTKSLKKESWEVRGELGRGGGEERPSFLFEQTL